VVESLSDIETSNFKALLTYHFLKLHNTHCHPRSAIFKHAGKHPKGTQKSATFKK